MQNYRFGEFELDVDAVQLRLRGKPVHLERRPLDLLILLVSRQGQLVPREEIIATLWPANVIIEFDAGLNTLVRKVRSALDDSSEHPQFIETVPGRGYRFMAPLQPPAETRAAAQQPATARKKTPRLRFVTVAALLFVAVGGAILTWRSGLLAREQTRIAVLPFENLTGDDELGYMASGIAEETSQSLAQIDLANLSVIGGVSANAFANSTVSLSEIGRELDADFLVASSLRLDKSRIRVASRLIRVADSEQVWSASFDRELTNLLGLQRELSIAIAEQIRQRLSPEIAAIIDRRQTQNPEAYELYLRGRYEWTRFQPDSIERAVQYYEQAVARDPGYALAWAGIAHALITSTVTVEASREAVLPASKEALQRALEFGPNLAETQLALGSFHAFLDQNLVPAEEAARRSVALDPNSAMSHMFLGILLAQQQGKAVEARTMLRRARELDPLFPLMFANSAGVALMGGEPNEALEFATQAIAINPEFWVGYLHLGGAHLELGNHDAALRAYADAEKYAGDNSSSAAASRAYLLAKLGRTDEAREVLTQLILRSERRYVPPFSIAVIHAALGDVDSAFEWLERGLAENNFLCLSLPDDRRLESLLADMRYQSLLKRCESVLHQRS